MIGAVFKTMWLRLWRDKGAFILAFVLPGFIFAIFAAIFSNASGGSLDIKVALANESQAPASVEFYEKVIEEAKLSISSDSSWTEIDIRERIRLGEEDVGLVIIGDMGDPFSPNLKVIKDPSKEVAATIVKAEIAQLVGNADHSQMPDLFAENSAMPKNANAELMDQSVTYYVGATAILFLLFSAMQGASLSIEERNSGIADRLMVGPSGALAMLSGKFLFLTIIGTLQAAIIAAVAQLFFNVPVLTVWPLVALACLGSAMLAAGLALLVAAICKTQPQMHAISTFLVLLMSAVGGSMVPRFMMPEWLQKLGNFTPNHWAIEAFYGVLARGQGLQDLLYVWVILFGGAIISLLLAAIISHKMMRV